MHKISLFLFTIFSYHQEHCQRKKIAYYTPKSIIAVVNSKVCVDVPLDWKGFMFSSRVPGCLALTLGQDKDSEIHVLIELPIILVSPRVSSFLFGFASDLTALTSLI